MKAGTVMNWSYVFNFTNAVLLILFIWIVYPFWKPYIRGKKITAIVEEYEHSPDSKKNKEYFCYKLMYRPQKAGKRFFCRTRTHYDTKEEMRNKYPKGTMVDILYYEDRGDTWAVITSDNDDRNQQILYTLILLVVCIGLSLVYVYLTIHAGS